MIQIKKKINISFFFLVLVFILLPFFIHAQGTPPSEPKTGASGLTWICKGSLPGDCTFADLISEVKNVVNFGTVFALIFSVVVIAVAGFKYMTSGANASKRSEANQTLLKAAIGIAIILGAWLIVKLITTALLKPGIQNLI